MNQPHCEVARRGDSWRVRVPRREPLLHALVNRRLRQSILSKHSQALSELITPTVRESYDGVPLVGLQEDPRNLNIFSNSSTSPCESLPKPPSTTMQPMCSLAEPQDAVQLPFSVATPTPLPSRCSAPSDSPISSSSHL